ncbi:MAG: hypothetical protein KAS38_10645 [Anaerolineales bacterium]|nr:hypothetical protein [Anaerolineales bacterium]
MKDKRSQVGWGFWLQWVVASTVGMLLGFIVGFPLSFLVMDIVGERLGQSFGGIVIGIGVGVLQWLVLRRRISGVGWWVLTSAAGGLIIPVAFEGLSESLSFGALMSFTGVVALGGAVAGTLQWLVLRGQVSRAGWWVLASTVGWGLGMTAAIAYSWPGPMWLIVTGAVLGAVTGGALVWLLRKPVPEV